MAASDGNRALVHSFESHPELLLLLNYTPFVPFTLCQNPDGSCNALSEKQELLHAEDIALEIERFLRKLDLNSVDILYLYGVGLGHHYAALREWLHAKGERRLIILEEDLGVVSALQHSEHCASLLDDPQVIFHFNTDPKSWDTHLQMLVATYPSERVEIAPIEFYHKRKKRQYLNIRMQVLRLSAVDHALMTEALYSHKLLPNLLRNIKRWPRSFLAGGLKGKFRNVPAVICGAGPSLSDSLPYLKELEDKALIIAGGSTIAALSNRGILPHLGIALDPNPEEFERLKIASSYEVPLIYATRLQPDVFNTTNAEFGYLVSDTGGPCETYFEKVMEIEGKPIGPELGSEALSVTTLAIALAVEMGCNPILLNGIDLAYTGMRRYAEGVMPCSEVKTSEMRAQRAAPERMLKRKNIHGHYVYTLVKWVMESDCIAAYAKNHPGHRFYNVSSHGLGFADIPNAPLADLLQSELTETLDLRGLVHAEIQQLQLPNFTHSLRLKMQAVKESLMRLGSIAEGILEELGRIKEQFPSRNLPSGKLAILEIDFQEEIAFECLFPAVGPALSRLLDRAFFSSTGSSEEDKQRTAIEKQLAKWRQWKEMIDAEILVFQSLNLSQ
ncbi:MAG: 6-hydroxymethylpterin diphosphokinase MptE-like protein [Chlamydiota bacterium]